MKTTERDKQTESLYHEWNGVQLVEIKLFYRYGDDNHFTYYASKWVVRTNDFESKRYSRRGDAWNVFWKKWGEK